jgi:DNA (cytosine-5)-methyltransferase 1
MLENVKNLVSHDKGRTFEIISGTLKELGYTLHFKVMDGQEYVPQHRERIIIVGFDESVFEGKEEFSFPEAPPRKTVFRSILEDKVDEKYTLSDKLWSYLQVYAAKHKAKGNGFGFGMTNLDGVSRTLSARYYKDGSEVLIPQARGKNPRRMTPRECARLQGFPDDFIIPVSDNQAYKQYGNSVVVPLMVAIAGKVKNELTRINEPVPA